jgi:hypothetical protein
MDGRAQIKAGLNQGEGKSGQVRLINQNQYAE